MNGASINREMEMVDLFVPMGDDLYSDSEIHTVHSKVTVPQRKQHASNRSDPTMGELRLPTPIQALERHRQEELENKQTLALPRLRCRSGGNVQPNKGRSVKPKFSKIRLNKREKLIKAMKN